MQFLKGDEPKHISYKINKVHFKNIDNKFIVHPYRFSLEKEPCKCLLFSEICFWCNYEVTEIGLAVANCFKQTKRTWYKSSKHSNGLQKLPPYIAENTPLSWCGLLDVLPLQTNVTRPRLGGEMVWFLSVQWILESITVIWYKEHDQDGCSALEVYKEAARYYREGTVFKNSV